VDGLIGTLNFAAGETTKTITLNITDDLVPELTETFNVNLSNATNGTISDSQGVGTITDNDTPVLSIGDDSKVEGQFLVFNLSLSTPSFEALTFNLSAAGSGANPATAGADFSNSFEYSIDGGLTWNTATGNNVTFAAGATGMLVRIPTTDDSSVEPTETLTVSAGVVSGTATATDTGLGTITDNDQVAFNISGTSSLTEGGTATYTVSYTGTLADGQTATVNYGTANGTALAGSDYTANSGTLIFTGGGPTSLPIPGGVVTIDDNLAEPGPPENFQVTLSGNSANALIGTGSANTNILDNEPTISINSFSKDEGSKTKDPTSFDFTVTLSQAPTLASGPVTVHFATADGTATLADSDYQAKSGDITFGVGQTSYTITILVDGDKTTEPNDETFFVNLSGPSSNASIAVDRGTGTILNDDSINISDATVDEAAGTATFTVSLSNALPHPVAVDFAIADGTATAGSDYLAQTGTLTFAPGVTSQTITIPILNDAVFEGNETFTVNLSNASGDTIKDGLGVGTITDDDLPAALNIADLLTGIGPHSGDLGEFLRFDTQTSPGNTLVSLDSDGTGPALSVPLVTLHGMVIHDLSALLSPTPEYTP
jgi:hypothetical protein